MKRPVVRVPRPGKWPWAVLAQILGVALVVAGVGLLAGAAWAVLAAGGGLLTAGALAEAARERALARGRKRQVEPMRRAA